jgi:hypothetical protein
MDIGGASHLPQQLGVGSNSNPEIYNKLCAEFLKMKSNFEKIQNAQLGLRNVALEQSSLDNLIKASLNPMGQTRPRVDSLFDIRNQQMGRKRAMTIDGPERGKYVKLNHTNKSAFVSFKHGKGTEVVPDTKDEDENSKEAEIKAEEPRLNKKRTFAAAKHQAAAGSTQLLLSPDQEFSGRKRAKSF